MNTDKIEKYLQNFVKDSKKKSGDSGAKELDC